MQRAGTSSDVPARFSVIPAAVIKIIVGIIGVIIISVIPVILIIIGMTPAAVESGPPSSVPVDEAVIVRTDQLYQQTDQKNKKSGAANCNQNRNNTDINGSP